VKPTINIRANLGSKKRCWCKVKELFIRNSGLLSLQVVTL